MRLAIAAIGRLRAGPELELLEDYAARIRAVGRTQGFTRLDIREFEAPKGLPAEERRVRESALLLDASAGARRVILDERGENLSSGAFAALLAKWRDEGVPDVAFLVGGADGHEKSLMAKADLALAFGKATFPHLLIRLMLAEQLYRAMTILAGHPYHRA